jgi:hypothetical protein
MPSWRAASAGAATGCGSAWSWWTPQTGFQIWSETYDRTADDIFAIQDDIAGAIVGALRVQLQPRRHGGGPAPRASAPTTRTCWACPAGTPAPRSTCSRRWTTSPAVEEDPTYAPAQAGLALTYAVLPWYIPTSPSDIATDRGLERRRPGPGPRRPERRGPRGHRPDRPGARVEPVAAETAYRRAIEAQPSYATAHQWYAETLLIMGRLEEARIEIDRALELDPLSVAGRYVQAYGPRPRREYDTPLGRVPAPARTEPRLRPRPRRPRGSLPGRRLPRRRRGRRRRLRPGRGRRRSARHRRLRGPRKPSRPRSSLRSLDGEVEPARASPSSTPPWATATAPATGSSAHTPRARTPTSSSP